MENLIAHFNSEINRIAYNGSMPFKILAAEMNMSQSELSRRLGNDSLPLRFSDCIKIMIIKDDYSPLDILLDRGGYSRKINEKSPTELTENIIESINQLPEKLQEAITAIQNPARRRNADGGGEES